jgi:hypothetical protein
MLHAGNDSQFSVTSRSYHTNSRRPTSDTDEALAQPTREDQSQLKVQPNLFRRVNAELRVPSPPPKAPKLWRTVGAELQVQPSQKLPTIRLQKAGGISMKVRRNLFRPIRTETPVEETPNHEARYDQTKPGRLSSRDKRDLRSLFGATRGSNLPSEAKRNSTPIHELPADEQEDEQEAILQLSADERKHVTAYIQRLRSEKTQDTAESSDLPQGTSSKAVPASKMVINKTPSNASSSLPFAANSPTTKKTATKQPQEQVLARKIAAQNRALAGTIRMVSSTGEDITSRRDVFWRRVLTDDSRRAKSSRRAKPSRHARRAAYLRRAVRSRRDVRSLRAVPSRRDYKANNRKLLVSRVAAWLAEQNPTPQKPAQEKPVQQMQQPPTSVQQKQQPPARVFGSRYFRHDAVVDWDDNQDVNTLRELEWVEESESSAPRRSASLVVKAGVAGVDAKEGGGRAWRIPTVKIDRDEIDRIKIEKKAEEKAKKKPKKK